MTRLKKLFAGILAAMIFWSMMSSVTVLASADAAEADPAPPPVNTHVGDDSAVFRLRNHTATFEIDNHGRPLSWKKLRNLDLLTAGGQQTRLFRGQDELGSEMAVQTGDCLAVGSDPHRSVYVVVLKADLLQQGSVNIAQLVRAARSLHGTVQLDVAERAAADINNSENVDIADVARMAHYLVSLSAEAGPFDDLPDAAQQSDPSADGTSEGPQNPNGSANEDNQSGLSQKPAEIPEDTPPATLTPPAADASGKPDGGTSGPSQNPDAEPSETAEPSQKPDAEPSETAEPSQKPDPEPSETAEPSQKPDPEPSGTASPSRKPDSEPSETASPNQKPDPEPSETAGPNQKPNAEPTETGNPSQQPDAEPSESAGPSRKPDSEPSETASPNQKPDPEPGETAEPSPKPDPEPLGTASPSQQPDAEPSEIASSSQRPDAEPSGTSGPSQQPNAEPSETAEPSQKPNAEPMETANPSPKPDPEPSETARPSQQPAEPTETADPSQKPDAEPTPQPPAFWDADDSAELTEALRGELRRLRTEGSEVGKDIEFSKELEEAGKRSLLADGAGQDGDLDTQDGLAGDDGLIRYIAAVRLGELQPDVTTGRIAVSDAVDAVLGAEPHTKAPGREKLLDTLVKAEQVEAGIAVSKLSIPAETGTEAPAETLLIALILRPGSADEYGNAAKPDLLTAAIRKEMAAMRSRDDETRENIVFQDALDERAAAKIAAGTVPAGQDGLMGADGVIDFVIALPLAELPEEEGSDRDSPERIAQLVFADEDAEQARLWDTLRKAESVEAGVAAAFPAGASDTALVAVCLRPDAAGGLWNLRNSDAFIQALVVELKKLQDPGCSLNLDAELTTEAEGLIPKSWNGLRDAFAGQDGIRSRDGRVEILFELPLKAAAGAKNTNANYNLIPVRQAAERAVSRALDGSDAHLTAWAAFAVASRVEAGIAVSPPAAPDAPFTDSDNPGSVYIQLVMNTDIGKVLWNPQDPHQLPQKFVAELARQLGGKVTWDADNAQLAEAWLGEGVKLPEGKQLYTLDLPLRNFSTPNARNLIPLDELAGWAVRAALDWNTGQLEGANVGAATCVQPGDTRQDDIMRLCVVASAPADAPLTF